MWTTKFWKDLAERMAATAAAGALAVLPFTQEPLKVLAAAGIAALVSLLKGLVASQKGDPESASLVE